MIQLSPSTRFVAVTPSDSVLVQYTGQIITGGSAKVQIGCKWIYVGGAGDLVVMSDNGASITFQNVAAGTLLPISTDHVMAATTATNIIALF